MNKYRYYAKNDFSELDLLDIMQESELYTKSDNYLDEKELKLIILSMFLSAIFMYFYFLF